MVAILIVIACIVLYLVMDVLKEHSDKNNKESEYVNHRSRRDPPATGSNANVQATNEPKVKVFTDEEIISSDIFQEEVKKYSKVVMWMTFAGGDEPLLPPIVWYDEKAKCIRLEKKGYEVYIGSYLDYKNGKSWPEREAALNRFFEDLFKKKTEVARKNSMVNIEYIADHLIKFEDLSQKSFYPESDFVIDYEIYFKNLPQWHRDDRDIANLYIREARM